jgi:hypothetical protein
MTVDEIFAEWEADSDIKATDLDREALKIPKLHHKYYRILSGERMKLRKAEGDFMILKKQKQEYYMGTLDQETLREKGWRPFRIRVLKQDLATYTDADEEIIQHTLKMAVLKEKIEILDSIIRTVGNRGFQIKSAIDFIKFKNGEF